MYAETLFLCHLATAGYPVAQRAYPILLGRLPSIAVAEHAVILAPAGAALTDLSRATGAGHWDTRACSSARSTPPELRFAG